MATSTTKTNKPLNPRGNDQSPLAFNRAKLYSGKALDFDGVNDYVESAEQITGLTTGLTFLGHVYIDSLSSGKNRIFTQWDGSKGWFLVTNGTDKNAFFRTNTSNGNVDLITDTAPFKVGEWMHIACTYNGAQMAFYIDGQLIDTAAQTGNITTPTSQKFRVGVNEAFGQPFNGKVTGTKVFDVALTQAQILDLYNNPEKVVPTGVDNTALKLWLPMMEGAGTTAYDGSGNGNHGTISGATYVNGIGAPVAQSAVMDWNKGSNLAFQSNTFSAAAWVNYQYVTQNSIISPSGAQDGSTFTITSGQSFLGQTPTMTPSTTYTLSIYAKKGNWDIFRIGNSSSSTNAAWFDLTNGTTGNQRGGTSTIEAVGTDGWYRCSYTTSNPNTGGFTFFANLSTAMGETGAPANGSTMYFYGAQVEQASSVGPYVRTGATAQPTPVLLPQGLTSGRDITGVNLFENVRKQGALNLDGNSWAEVHDNASLDITSAITLEAWVYWDNSEHSKGILGKWDPSVNQCYLIYTASSSRAQFYSSSTGADAAAVEFTIPSNGWVHIVGTDDGTNQKLYINGTEEATASSLGSIFESALPLEIGRYDANVATNYHNDIAQPRIYNRALTAEEVQRNYNAGKNIYK